MAEPTRPLPSLMPLSNGGFSCTSTMTPCEFTVRGLALKPSGIIVPVIVVPGIMGTNLRAKANPDSEEEENKEVERGKPAWRPPNTAPGGLWDSSDWDDLSPAQRQRQLDPDTLEVDNSGPVHIPHGDGRFHVDRAEVRQRWWGEVHADSYGPLLCALRIRLSNTFRRDGPDGERRIADHWREVMDFDPQRWGVRRMKPLTEAELEKHARHHYPVYACGYNFLESCEKSSQRLEQRILEIIESWRSLKRQCDQVILVTHSMGGLVTRACAKRIPEKIAGIIHGVMPALGAPAAYRRIACGTESSSPSNSDYENFRAQRTAMMLGETTDKTTPVLATSPGALELLPNHLYPGPWLHVRVMQILGAGITPSYEVKGKAIRFRESSYDCLHLPSGQVSNPYDLYRDMTPWYRLINIDLADPAKKYRKNSGGVEKAITVAIDKAERFHRALGDWYHPNTYAFYGDDKNKLSYGQVSWLARMGSASATALTTSNVTAAQYLGHTKEGRRIVLVDGKTELHFEPAAQEANGDGTVPHQSGAGPAGKVKQVFPTTGYTHQGSYNDDMVMLTLRLIVKIAQGIT